MKALARVLAAKIAMTASVWALPLLCFPVEWLQWLGFPVQQPVLFIRLLGMAYAALLVGYALGLRDALRSRYPAGVVWVGLVSNGGASVLLAWSALEGLWDAWGLLARLSMWVSLLGTAGVAAALLRFGVLKARDGLQPPERSGPPRGPEASPVAGSPRAH